MIYVFAGGKIEDELIEELKILTHDTVIAADGGVNILFKWNLLPHFLIGDLDSASSEAIEWCEENGVTIIKYPQKKDYIDLELALMKAAEFDDKPIIVFGAWGDRPDQTMVSFRLLEKYQHADIILRNLDWESFLLKEPGTLESYPGQIWSFLCAGDKVEGLTLQGFEYELSDYEMSHTETMTISNVALGKHVSVRFRSGKLFVFRQWRVHPSTKSIL
ncbi:MAG: thiamine pyrophosphokinae [Thermotogota bacterium]|nr:thiamine pyrophosphokinae [Thermotogota bacterium]MDK2865061.1 thiamine pyrophosphokinae [Thermotogota bacterium]HCZ06601.1 thiamine diphosphokinase [Thermotogota bacterium]